jgi:hypothetical protein
MEKYTCSVIDLRSSLAIKHMVESELDSVGYGVEVVGMHPYNSGLSPHTLEFRFLFGRIFSSLMKNHLAPPRLDLLI